ncbi:MAG: hypothetical protein ACYDH1_13750 [Anaerolineaceae bacterium]|jgi:hypothetical protein|nr:MAG: hypothetical protein CVU46_15055 [Chloroflexi bacterium HGW-Chloroflexi-8]
MLTVIVHINNEDPILGEIDELSNPEDQLVILKNPRRKDGKDVHFLEASVSTIIIPIHRINFVEVMPTGVEEEIISFVRE